MPPTPLETSQQPPRARIRACGFASLCHLDDGTAALDFGAFRVELLAAGDLAGLAPEPGAFHDIEAHVLGDRLVVVRGRSFVDGSAPRAAPARPGPSQEPRREPRPGPEPATCPARAHVAAASPGAGSLATPRPSFSSLRAGRASPAAANGDRVRTPTPSATPVTRVTQAATASAPGRSDRDRPRFDLSDPDAELGDIPF